MVPMEMAKSMSLHHLQNIKGILFIINVQSFQMNFCNMRLVLTFSHAHILHLVTKEVEEIKEQIKNLAEVGWV